MTHSMLVTDESTHTLLLMGPSENGLYSLQLPQLKSIPKLAFTATKASSSIWHQRIGHPHQRVFTSLITCCSLPVTTKPSSLFCTPYQLRKSSKLSLPCSKFRSNKILDLIYCDVWGPSPTTSLGGYRYPIHVVLSTGTQV